MMLAKDKDLKKIIRSDDVKLYDNRKKPNGNVILKLEISLLKSIFYTIPMK